MALLGQTMTMSRRNTRLTIELHTFEKHYSLETGISDAIPETQLAGANKDSVCPALRGTAERLWRLFFKSHSVGGSKQQSTASPAALSALLSRMQRTLRLSWLLWRRRRHCHHNKGIHAAALFSAFLVAIAVDVNVDAVAIVVATEVPVMVVVAVAVGLCLSTFALFLFLSLLSFCLFLPLLSRHSLLTTTTALWRFQKILVAVASVRLDQRSSSGGSNRRRRR